MKKRMRIQRLQIALDRWGEKLAKQITPKRLAVFLTVIYLLSLVPLLWIGWYNYPSADDYSVGSNCRQAWVNSHNILTVLGAGIARAVKDWLEWMGYFTCNLLTAFSPSTFGERGYVLTAWIMIGMLSLSTWYLLKNIFVRVFHADQYLSHSIIMCMLFVTVQCMVGRVEAFYWYAGAANYMLVHCISLFFYGLLIATVYDKGKKKVWDLTLASILGFFAGGGNQMTALNVAVIMVVVLVFGIVLKKWKEYRTLLIPVIMALTGFALNVAAPGNWVRAESANGMNPVKAVLISFYYCLDYCVDDWSGWPVALLLIILVPLFWKLLEKTAFAFSYPLVVILFGYCLVSAMMTPPLFAVGNMGAARLQALTFTMYILVLVLCEGYLIGYLRHKWGTVRRCVMPEAQESVQEAGVCEQLQDGFSVSQIWCLIGCMFFFAAAAVITVIPDPDYFTMSSAVTDLANGSAKAYGEARKARIALYESGEKDVVVEELPSQPALLYFSDIKEDPEDWENRGLCRFYGLDSVRVQGE